MSVVQSGNDDGNSFYAAMARTAARGVALYFSRPVRLFRPSKVSGWQILRGLAYRDGQSLTPQYISGLVKSQGVTIIPRHFLPPMAVNLALGSVLWATYGESVDLLSNHISSPALVSALSGGLAGGAQALLAAPAENLRFLLEGGTATHGWSHAWKEVFRGSDYHPELPKEVQLHQARQVKVWMKEVGEMAGRGWNGWGWGVAKDTCGFALFFTLFELTRCVASQTSRRLENCLKADDTHAPTIRHHIPRVVHALALVCGGAGAGFSYELACRPWDIARKVVHIDRVIRPDQHHSNALLLLKKLKDEGLASFFVNPSPVTHESSRSLTHRRLQAALRTLARVGPWGVGFLVWESFGPGRSYIPNPATDNKT